MSRPSKFRLLTAVRQAPVASGTTFDKMWLDVISAHHSAAIQMAEIEKRGGKLPGAKQLAESIIQSQSEEIRRFNALAADMEHPGGFGLADVDQVAQLAVVEPDVVAGTAHEGAGKIRGPQPRRQPLAVAA